MKQPKNKTVSGIANIVNTIVTEIDSQYTAGVLNTYDDPAASLVGSMIEGLYYLANVKNKKLADDAAINVRNYDEELKTKSEHDTNPELQGVRRHDNIALEEAIEMLDLNKGHAHDEKVVADTNLKAVKSMYQDMMDCHKAMFDREYILVKDRQGNARSGKRPVRKLIA